MVWAVYPHSKMVKMVWACGWGVGCVPLPSENSENYIGLWLGCGLCTLVKIVKIVKMVLSCGWGMVCVPLVKMVKLVKIVWACTCSVGCVPLMR